MMRAIVSKSDLVRICTRAALSSDAKSAQGMLRSILLESSGSSLTATGTDLYQSTRDTATASGVVAGSVAVSAKDMVARAQAMPDGDVVVDFDRQGAKLSVKSAKSKLSFSLLAIDGGDFPSLPTMGESITLSVKGSLLARLLARVLPAVSLDTSRAALNAVCLDLSPGEIHAVATDGHRLTVSSLLVECDVTERALIPLPAAKQIERICSSTDSVVTVSFSSGLREVFVVAEGAQFSAKLVDGQFPNWRGVIPKKGAPITVDKSELARSIRAVALSSPDKTAGVRIALSDNRIVLSGESADRGQARDEISCGYAGPDAKFAVDSKLMLDAIAAVDGDIISVSLSGGELDPICWEPEHGNEAFGVIMPMRLDA